VNAEKPTLPPLKLLERARPEIVALQPYSSARMEARSATVMLNANESPWAPVGSEDSTLNRYPDPQPEALRARLAELYDVRADQLLIGRGSDEAIDLLVRAFCREGRDSIAISPPTFGMYAVAAHTQGAAIIENLLDAQSQVDVAVLLGKIDTSTKLVFVCTPNNPTGAQVPLARIAQLAEALRDRAVIVVDEAYFEFTQANASATNLLSQHDNIVVLRTLSKAYALAGLRIGSLIAHAQIVALLRRIQAPYPLPTMCIQAALAALSPAGIAQARSRIDTLLLERERLARILPKAPGVLKVYNSAANFLCVRFVDAQKVYRDLLGIGIVVRDVSHYPGLAGCLRITIGSPQENAQLFAALGLREAAA
jgi:histidinol-phosphate aminotransferase